ncbi:type II secretion system protein [Pseudoxanthomonas sp.]|uniref:type II secretion system protein n=1 Tax=Pseudoxanthomonas sp. TaxID=1871049 RepID=UPI00258974A2|nr:type II secretion system protein [Pseudoxanthomonas sp.]MCR6685648.1 type II secretion system GspH family protein [Pseudoxanthomonas sp.]
MMAVRPARSSSGFTLLEMAVVLIVCAVLAVAILPLLPLAQKIDEEQQARADLERANEALTGYLDANLRLPSPDTDGDGLEDAGSTSGLLPTTTLGLDQRAPLAYRVNTDLTLPPSPTLYQPALPVGHAGPAGANGLDLCVRLEQLQRTAALLAATDVVSAFVLVRGVSDGGGANPALGDFAVPNDPDAYDPALRRSALGLGEAYARLACPDRLRRAFASAQAAVTANSAVRLAELQLEFRDFDVEVSRLELQNAKTGLSYGEFDLAIGVLDVAMATVQVIMDIPPDDAFEAAVAGVELAAATVQLGFLIADIIAARHGGIDDAEDALADKEELAARSLEQRDRMILLREAASLRAVELDQAGAAR